MSTTSISQGFVWWISKGGDRYFLTQTERAGWIELPGPLSQADRRCIEEQIVAVQQEKESIRVPIVASAPTHDWKWIYGAESGAEA